MTIEDLKKKWLELVRGMNEKGIPLPLVRDPRIGSGSVSLTLVFLSFNLCAASILGKALITIARVLHIGISLDDSSINLLSDIDTSQALNLFMACAALYFGRRLSKDDKGVSVEGKDEPKA